MKSADLDGILDYKHTQSHSLIWAKVLSVLFAHRCNPKVA